MKTFVSLSKVDLSREERMAKMDKIIEILSLAMRLKV